MRTRLSFLLALGFSAVGTWAQTGPGGVGNAASNVLWLRGEYGVTAVGVSVTDWKDGSGNSNNATSPSLAAQPTLVAGALNNYPILSFDGVGNQLRIPDANSLDLQQWDIFMVNSVATAKNNNAWLAKGTNTQPNYALWSPINGALQMPIYDIFTLLSSPATAAGTTGAAFTLLEYNNTVILGLFPSRTVYKFGTNIYNDVNLLQLPAMNNNQLYIGNVQGTAGWNLNGNLAETIIYNAPINTAQRVIINNYLAAKYGLALAVNDIYLQDNPANGDYDHDVAGIGRISSTSAQTDSRGSGVVQINNATGLGNNEFLIWGHDNGILGAWGSSDYPPPLQGRWIRVWRVNEVNPSGLPVDVGNVDMTFDLTNQGPVTASDLRLLVDINNNGIFADDVPVPIMATWMGGNLYRFAGVSQLVNNRRFTLGTINYSQTPLPIELLYFNAKAEDNSTVRLGWATATEHNNDHFVVQRSADAIDWEDVVEVPGVGNSTSTTVYADSDPAPMQGLSYYRLIQVDADGSSTNSNAVAVLIDRTDNTLIVFPDPAQDLVNVLFNPALGKGEVHLLNDLGQSFPAPTTILDGRAQVDVSKLPAGGYVLMVITDRQVLKKRLVIAR